MYFILYIHFRVWNLQIFKHFTIGCFRFWYILQQSFKSLKHTPRGMLHILNDTLTFGGHFNSLIPFCGTFQILKHTISGYFRFWKILIGRCFRFWSSSSTPPKIHFTHFNRICCSTQFSYVEVNSGLLYMVQLSTNSFPKILYDLSLHLNYKLPV